MSDCCPCCRHTHATHYAEENGFELVKCSSCGTLYVVDPPAPQTIERGTRVGVHQGASALNVNGRPQRRKTHRLAREFEQIMGSRIRTKNLRWLDIGCGYGESLLALTKINPSIEAIGFEPNTNKADWARRAGLNVVDSINLVPGNYDVISALNVFSHLPDPIEQLVEWAQLLRSDGELLIETGDIADLSDKDCPRPLYLPDHLVFTNRRALVSALESRGLDVLNVHLMPLVPLRPSYLLVESLKLMAPGHRSLLPYMVGPARRSDMWVRARVTAASTR